MTHDNDNPDIAWDAIKMRFVAYLYKNGRQCYLGSFRTFDDAAIARTESAWLYIQQFANQS